MRVFIPVFFNAPFSGLHSHVRAQCAALTRAQHKVTVLCKPGPFAAILQREGVEILGTDFNDLEAAIGLALSEGPFDLIHAHPFASRRVGLAVANATGVPLVVTFHREYVDDLNGWHDAADAIIAVSPVIRDYLWGQTDVDPTKLLMIPNGVDLSVFTSAAHGQERASFGRQAICFASRLDADKSFAWKPSRIVGGVAPRRALSLSTGGLQERAVSGNQWNRRRRNSMMPLAANSSGSTAGWTTQA